MKKFKSKHIETNEWIYGIPISCNFASYYDDNENPKPRDRTLCIPYGYVNTKSSCSIITNNDTGYICGFDCDCVEVINNTTEEYTEMKDINEKEIYTGDICSLKEFGDGRYDADDYEVRLSHGGYEIHSESIVNSLLLSDCIYQIEITGTIHD